MSVDKTEDLFVLKRGKGPSWASIPLEIRLKIWALAYTTQGPRLVEVRTAEHNHSLGPHLRWCPRYSLSPSPNVVNICREARDEAQRIAEQAGHLIFNIMPEAPKIYFNSDIDTLYVPNERDYWIRDWGPEGILTEFQSNHQPERLRFLAIGLEPLTRATTSYSLYRDLIAFQKLEEIIFVVKKTDDDILTLIKRFDRCLQMWAQDLVLSREKVRCHPYPRECRLAIRHALHLEFVKKEKNTELARSE